MEISHGKRKKTQNQDGNPVYSVSVIALLMADSLKRPHYAWAVVVLLLTIQFGLLAYSDYVHSPTLNEPAHLAAGISHWQSGDFGLYRVNPPLVRMIAALPVLAAGVTANGGWSSQDPVDRTDFFAGADLIATNGERSFFLFTIARCACIPFAWIGGVVCFLWARDLFGPLAGILATTLWCFSPNILAHGSLITPDMPATALYVAACYLFWRWLRSPSWEQAILAGIVLGVAELTKTTFIFLYPFLPLLWVLYRFSDRAKMYARRLAQEGVMLLVCLVVGIFVINLGYGFDGAFTQLGQFQFISRTFAGQESSTVGNRFADTWLGSLPVPFPEDYVRGIDVQRRDFEHFGRPSYLAGEFKNTGWWYYYLYALAIKVPLGIWGLLLLVAALRFTKQGQLLSTYTLRDELVLLLPAVLIFTIVSSQTGFSEHLRYVLPMAPFVFIWIGQIARPAIVQQLIPSTVAGDGARVRATRAETPSFPLRKGRIGAGWRSWCAILAGGLLAWAVGSSLLVYPHSLSYFNELVGGPTGGNAYLLGSNADWGQDLKYLEGWLGRHPSIDVLYLAYCGHYDPIHLGLKYSAPPPCDPETKQMPELKPGWYAISVNFLRGYPWFAYDGQGGHTVYGRNALSYFLELRPVAIVGTSIYIFHI